MVESDNQKLYRVRFDERDRGAKADVWRVIVERFFQRWVAAGDTVLDLGCGYGEFLNHLRCARRIGVDLNPDSADSLDPDIEFHQSSVLDLGFVQSQSVDTVFTSNLLEHLADKTEVERLLTEARRVLKRGGHLILLGPNIRFLPGQYWDFWDHLVPITDRSLCELLRKLDFSIVKCVPKFLPYTTRSRLPQAGFLVYLYLKLPLAWRFFGRQFLIRAQV